MVGSRRNLLHLGCTTAAALGLSVVASAVVPAPAVAQSTPAAGPSGEDFFYREDWFGEPWRKPETAVLIHGNDELSIVWYAWMPRMAREFRVLRPDLPGFGRSLVPAGFEWSLPSLATFVVHVLDKAGVESAAHHRRQDRRRGRDAVCGGLPDAHAYGVDRERSRFPHCRHQSVEDPAVRPARLGCARKRWSSIGKACSQRRRRSPKKASTPHYRNSTWRGMVSCSASKPRPW